MTRLIILDRDGVINEDSDDYIKSADEWLPIDGSIDAIARLYHGGFTPVVATNQSGIGRGLFDLDDLEAMHQKLTGLLLAQQCILGGIYYCPHTPEDNCRCRKPATGLLDAMADDFNSPSFHDTYFIGDSLKDLQAATARQCLPVLVRTGKGRKTEQQLQEEAHRTLASNTMVFDNLADAATFILNSQP